MIKTRQTFWSARLAGQLAGALGSVLALVACAQAAPLAAVGAVAAPMQVADTLGALAVSGTAAVTHPAHRALPPLLLYTRGRRYYKKAKRLAYRLTLNYWHVAYPLAWWN